MNKKLLKETLLVGGITLFFTFLILEVWNMKLSIAGYSGDGLSTGYLVKTIQDFGWWFKNPRVGAPFYGTMYDYPSLFFDSFSFFIFKIILVFFRDWGKAINIFYIMLFPVTSMITYFSMKKFKLNSYISLLTSLYFTFSFYRFLRGMGHIFLNVYFTIPLITLVFYFLYTDDTLLNFEKDFFHKKKNIFVLITLIILSLSGIYYTFFSCYFLVVIFIAKVNKSNFKHFSKKLGLMFGTIFFTMFLFYIPKIIYTFNFGKNPESPERAASEADFYGLRISRLLLSPKLPRILSKVKHGYLKKVLNNCINYFDYLKGMESTEYLGIIGIIGFFFLLWIILIKKKQNNKLIELLALLNITGILLGIASGFGSIFAIFGSASIRGYNRISIFILYFCILAVASKLNDVIKEKRYQQHYIYILLFLLFSFSIWEQIPPNISYTAGVKSYKEKFDSDKQFVIEIEKTLGKNGMVFQLPYFKFPENGPINGLGDYELFKGYLFSKNIKWSYGGYRGRDSDLWNQYITSLPPKEMLEKISIVGFNGLYIDKKAYTEEEFSKLENEIKSLTNEEPMISLNKDLYFFNLVNFSNNIKSKYTKAQFEKEKNKILTILQQYNNFYYLEKDNSRTWRWMENKGEIILKNNGSENLNCNFMSNVFSGYPEDSELIVDINGKKEKYKVNSKGIALNLSFNMKKGKNKIRFSTNAKQVNSYPDMRNLYLRFDDIKINFY